MSTVNENWNNLGITPEQQRMFLDAAGLDSLPELEKLTEAQWSMLTGIVGVETVDTIRESVGLPPLSDPQLPPPEDVGDWTEIMRKIAHLKTKLSDLMNKVSSEDIQKTREDMERINKENAENIQKALEKMKKAGTSGLLSKIFGWIGAAISLISALALTIVSGGGAAPLLAMAIIGVAMMALDEGGAMAALMEAAAEISPEFAMALQVTIAAVMLIASIACGVASGGASFTNVIAKVMGIVGQIVGGFVSVGSGASGIAQSAYSFEASEIQADTKDNQAWLAKLQQLLSEEADRLEQIIQRLNEDMSDISGIISDISNSHSTIIQNFSM